MKRDSVVLGDLRFFPNSNLDQFFLKDKRNIPVKMALAAGITKEDRVLEVGPGLGILTHVLARCAKEVIAIEIDEGLKPFYKTLPNNVEVIYGDAYKLLNDAHFRESTKPPTKVVSSIPYSQAQNMLHNYTNYPWYQGDIVWLAPLSLADKVNKEPILGAYFKANVVEIVPKSEFFPEPNTTSAIIYFKRIDDPTKTGNFEIYFRRWLYNHEDWKVKNAIREGIIKSAYDLKGVRVTKNEARNLMKDLEIPEDEFEKLTNNIRPEYYLLIPEKLEKWFRGL